MASERTSHLTNLTQPVWKGKKEKIERERRRKREEELSEKISLLSKFSGEQSVESRQDKKQSWSPLQELQVGTGIGEFR